MFKFEFNTPARIVANITRGCLEANDLLSLRRFTL